MNTQETENVWNFVNDGLSLLKPEKLSADIDSPTKSTHHGFVKSLLCLGHQTVCNHMNC